MHHVSTLREWQADPRGWAVFMAFYRELQAQGIHFLGEDADPRGAAVQRDMVAMYLDMPLASVLHFQDIDDARSPEEMAAGLLEAVG